MPLSRRLCQTKPASPVQPNLSPMRQSQKKLDRFFQLVSLTRSVPTGTCTNDWKPSVAFSLGLYQMAKPVIGSPMPLTWRSPCGARVLRMATSGTITSQATPIFLFDSGVQKRTYLDRPVSALLPEPSTRSPSASNTRALSW